MMLRSMSYMLAACTLALAAFTAHAANPAQETMPSQAAMSGKMDAMTVPAWLVGTWTLVRCDNIYPDGHRVELYGPHPQGTWMIDAHGHYAMQIARMQRTPFASGDKSKGTPDEYRAASMDSNAHFGSIAVKDNQIATHIEQASFPNWNGKDGKTSYTLQGNQLTYVVAKPSSGAAEGAHGEVVWQRID